MRIIAGVWRGRPLETPAGGATRPTADRVRETLFSMLASRLGSFEDLSVADLFAGSGALGFEALSRGADAFAPVPDAADALRISSISVPSRRPTAAAAALPASFTALPARLPRAPPPPPAKPCSASAASAAVAATATSSATNGLCSSLMKASPALSLERRPPPSLLRSTSAPEPDLPLPPDLALLPALLVAFFAIVPAPVPIGF